MDKWTKEYRNQYARKWKKEHSENIKRNNKKYRENNQETIKSRSTIHRAKHRKLLEELKVNGCAICGYDKYSGALDFHHGNPEDKKFAIGRKNMGYTDKRIIDELNKCILLCANCHREIHDMVIKY